MRRSLAHGVTRSPNPASGWSDSTRIRTVTSPVGVGSLEGIYSRAPIAQERPKMRGDHASLNVLYVAFEGEPGGGGKRRQAAQHCGDPARQRQFPGSFGFGHHSRVSSVTWSGRSATRLLSGS